MKHKNFVAVVTSAALTLSVAPSIANAQSSYAGNTAGHAATAPQRAASNVKTVQEDQQPEYSDREVAQLLLAGQGRISEEKPELLGVLGFSTEKPDSDMTKLNLMIDEYLETTPDFHEKVSVPFQSGNPQEVDAGLIYLSETFLDYADARQEIISADDAALQGWTWMGANVAIYANAIGVANAVGYTNAAVATLAVATIAFVTWYLPGESGEASTIDREERIADLAAIISR